MRIETIECWLCVDSDGNHGIGRSADEARESYANDVQDLSEADGFRLVQVNVTVPLPEPVTLAVEAPALGNAVASCK